jgi:hypothetical protein
MKAINLGGVVTRVSSTDGSGVVEYSVAWRER